jgi:hypothetical protein
MKARLFGECRALPRLQLGSSSKVNRAPERTCQYPDSLQSARRFAVPSALSQALSASVDLLKGLAATAGERYRPAKPGVEPDQTIPHRFDAEEPRKGCGGASRRRSSIGSTGLLFLRDGV